MTILNKIQKYYDLVRHSHQEKKLKIRFFSNINFVKKRYNKRRL